MNAVWWKLFMNAQMCVRVDKVFARRATLTLFIIAHFHRQCDSIDKHVMY